MQKKILLKSLRKHVIDRAIWDSLKINSVRNSETVMGKVRTYRGITIIMTLVTVRVTTQTVSKDIHSLALSRFLLMQIAY